jgi:nicotinate-nucleotide adenylyltransferase
MRNVAVFGGSFNPVHWGHLLIAATAVDQFELDQVIWVPTYRSPHKGESLERFGHRLEMVRRAIADHPAFTASDIDAHRQGVSYAIATLTDLQPLYPNSNWFWIIGIDAFQTLPRWHKSEALAAQCTWLVAPRSRQMEEWEREEVGESAGGTETREPRDAENPIQNSQVNVQKSSNFPDSPLQICQRVAASANPPLYWHLLEMPKIEISSSLVRQACRDGRSIRYWVPEAVRLYILEFKLYVK